MRLAEQGLQRVCENSRIGFPQPQARVPHIYRRLHRREMWITPRSTRNPEPAAGFEANVSVFLKRSWMFGVAGGELLNPISPDDEAVGRYGAPGLVGLERAEIKSLTHPLRPLAAYGA